MRARLIGAVILALAAVSLAQAQTPSKAGETVAGKELREKQGSMSEKLLRGEPLPESDKLVSGTIPDFEPIGAQLERVRREAEMREVLRGKKGPFAQAMAAWKEREWPPLLYAIGTLVLWAVGVILVIWIIGAIVNKFRQQ